jgi:hypothetical protein
MNMKRLFSFGFLSEQVVAVFGEARLLKRLDGRLVLVGGTSADHFAAREWCSWFEHELVFSCGPVKVPA